MVTAYKPYLNLTWGILALFLLSFLAFYPGYIAKLHSSLPFILHVHTALMLIWMGMLMIQPYLIRKKEFNRHRKIGKWSYVIVPLLLISAYMMIQYSYDRAITELHQDVASGKSRMTPEEIIHQARVFMGLPLYYFIGFILLYAMAVFNKRKPIIHAQYIVATALMLTGPVLDRVLFSASEKLKITVGFPLELASFLIADIVILIILGYNINHKNSTQPALVCLTLFIAGQLGYFFGLDSKPWQAFTGLILP